MEKTAKELKEGDAFKTSPKEKNLKVISKIFDLSAQENTRAQDKEKLLFVVDGCRQVTLHRDAPVY